jgi:choline-sulfatase
MGGAALPGSKSGGAARVMKHPNLLILMADQLTGCLFPDGPAPFLQVPHLRRLAERSTRFASAYCASPLCAPSRASFMTGLLPSRTGVYDNAAELPSALPTFAHLLRRAGYSTILCGKMHFVGPDQLHGFEARLTTDIYPADFGWTPDWTRPEERIDWWYHNLGSVTEAGTALMTNQLDYDDEVAHHARACLHDLARRADRQPFCLCVSFTHPHDPFVARPEFWDLYDHATLPMPAVAPIAYADQDAHSRRLLRASDHARFAITEADVRRSRHAYLANISYVDAKIGELLAVLERCGLAEDTVILVCADHGEMLGERGLWFKMSFYEGSARVPLMISAPGRMPAGTVRAPVSLLDVMPTLLELAGIDPAANGVALDGQSLVPLATGAAAAHPPARAEYAAEGSAAPLVMLRDGRWKLVCCPLDPPQLFDLAADPLELSNRAGDPACAERLAAMTAQIEALWDLARLDAEVRVSQARRRLVYAALRNGHYYPWDFQPLQRASERYMRNHMDLNVLEAQARFPRADRHASEEG